MNDRTDSAPATAPLDVARNIEEQLVVTAFARLRPVPLGISLGLICGLGLFAATAFLLLKEAVSPSDVPVGSHLNLLGHYFPGYVVTWGGSVLGLLYGLGLGFVLGFISAALVNFNHLFYLRVLRRRLRRRAIHDGL